MALLTRTLGRSRSKADTAMPPGRVLLVAGVIVVVVALLQLMQSSEAVTSSFAIQGLGSERLELRTRVSQLEAEIAALSSLSRVEREAQERLGLVPATGQQSVQVNVPWPAGSQQQLPSRFAASEAAAAEAPTDESGWWRDLLDFLPFY